MREIKRVAVLGAGVMGSGIAAHLAGAGIDVLLLDIVPPNGPSSTKAERNAFAQGGLDRALKAKPAAFFSARDAERVTIGNFDDDLAAAGQCDWVVEVVKEDISVKRALFAKLEPLLAPHTIVTSNTSGLPIQLMNEGRSESWRKRFFVTHFFNPVRYMKLLEVVSGRDTDHHLVEKLAQFGADVLGKGIVFGKDTPNFVANRIGVFAMMHLIHQALAGGFTVEEIDAIFGAPLGRPRSAVFRTADMVGLDTVVEVANNCHKNLPHDERREDFKVPSVLVQMVERKMLGDKSGGGFGKKAKDGILSLDLASLEYRPQKKAKLASVGAVKGVEDVRARVKQFLAQPDKYAELARKVTWAVLSYASHRLGEIADDVVNIDRAMRWGFAWELGPFETWDAIGVADAVAGMESIGYPPAQWVKDMLATGRTSFYSVTDGTDTYWDQAFKNVRPVSVSSRALSLAPLKRAKKVVFENDAASLIDIGDRIACLEFHSKMNAIDADMIDMIHRSVDEVEKSWDGLVIGNQASDAFCAGANLFLVVMAANQGNWKAIGEMSERLQSGLMRLKYCAVPTVTAPFGLTLGGGAEVAMHASATRAHAELYMGLVEVGMGLLPAGGGCKELLARACAGLPDDADPFPYVKKVFFNVGLGKVSTSAEEARAMGFLNAHDAVTLNRDYLIEDAKQTALGLARAGYRPPRKRTFRVLGESGYATIRSQLQMMLAAHQVSAHDVVVGSKIAWVLTGGGASPNVPVKEEDILALEREAFVSLCGEEKTRERIQYFLMNNKPLRN